jgi:hypothetical protein
MVVRNRTPEQQQQQRQAIQRWKPWNQSTGPRSPEGKSTASRNAFTGGHLVTIREITKAMNQMLRNLTQR